MGGLIGMLAAALPESPVRSLLLNDIGAERIPEDLDIHASVGIDFGKFLLVRKTDMYGAPVNVASKLGEDIAKPGEILVSAMAMSRIPKNADIRSESATVNHSGIKIRFHRILF